MRRFLAFIVAGMAVAVPVFANPEITVEELREHVKFLASPELAGRFSLSPGERKAGDYVAGEFKRAGLQPKGSQGFFHSFTIPRAGYVAGGKSRLEARRNGRTQRFKVGDEFVPLGFSKQDANVTGEVVFVGYGISAPDEGWDDYAGVDVKGKIVLAFRGNPAKRADDLASYASVDAKEEMAREAGASGLILVGEPQPGAGELVPISGTWRRDENTLVAVSANLKVAQALLGEKPADVKARIDKGDKAGARPLGVTATLRSEIEVRKGEARNVVGFLPGNDPQLKDEIIVIGAHYDHLGFGETGSLSRTNGIHFGADDNASGTSAIIEIAEKFAADKSNRRSLLFIAFSGEELGLLGARAFLEKPTVDVSKIVAMMNLDMVGRMSENKLQVGGVGTAPDFETIVADANTDKFELQIAKTGRGPSDHAAFYAREIPVLFFFTGIHADYHRVSDTWDKINYPDHARVGQYVHRVVRAIDSRPERPKFTESSGPMDMAVQAERRSDEPGRMSLRVRVGFIPEYGDGKPGVQLGGATEGSPAAKAGVQKGDRLMKWDGQDVKDIEQLMALLMKAEPGREVVMVVQRGEQMLELKVTPEATARR